MQFVSLAYGVRHLTCTHNLVLVFAVSALSRLFSDGYSVACCYMQKQKEKEAAAAVARKEERSRLHAAEKSAAERKAEASKSNDEKAYRTLLAESVKDFCKTWRDVKVMYSFATTFAFAKDVNSLFFARDEVCWLRVHCLVCHRSISRHRGRPAAWVGMLLLVAFCFIFYLAV
jgi:hypothetical protein